MKFLSNRTALVTGASQGFGAAIAKALAAAGAKVAINYLTNDTRARILKEKIEKENGTALLCKADVTDESEVARMCADIETVFGSIDIAVLNASGPRPMLSIEELCWQNVLEELELFVKSPLILVQRIVPAMKAKKYGRIINIGSEVFELGSSNYSAYVAAKAAQLGLTRSWSRELAAFQITVNLVAPGFVLTERHKDEHRDVIRSYIASVPMKRMGTVSDIAEVVTFLASDQAGFITGQRISVNGGNTLE